jgi:site-specific DNA recombinase
MKTTQNSSELDAFIVFGKKSEFADRISGKNCVSYVRVSSKEQELGFSLETQSKEHLEAIEAEGFNCLGTFGGKYESAKTDERKEFNRMLKFVRTCKEKISYIVVSDATRFSRSGANAIYIADQLRKENIKIFCVDSPSDTDTAAGKMHQNIQFVFAQYDNDRKREKIIASGIEMLLEGYWCTKAPLGYKQVTRGKRVNRDLPVRQIITINETGVLLRKAFYWKAEGINNIEILRRLEKLGLTLRKQKLIDIFANPFYCGLMAHNWLNGKVVPGKHEALVPREIFLQANNMRARNCTWKHRKDFNEIPLKNFMKCADCGSSFCGYLVKKKGLWYYKCNLTGCKCNKSAKSLNSKFLEKLTEYTIPEKYIEPVRDEFLKYYGEVSEDDEQTAAQLGGRLKELEGKINALEERYAIGEIGADLYNKFIGKFYKDKIEINEELTAYQRKNSNLETRVNKYFAILSKPADLWSKNSYQGKLELQNLLFPSGILYDREKDGFRTPEINEVAVVTATISSEILGKKNGTLGLDNLKSRSVPSAGLEPACPRRHWCLRPARLPIPPAGPIGIPKNQSFTKR